MAHFEQLEFVRTIAERLFDNRKPYSVIEIGSYDVNGSVRSLFQETEYIGVDLCPGPGVDVVCSGHSVDFGDNRFDLSISCECFEHNPKWAETFLNMVRMTKPGGLVLITCASTGRLEHGTTRTSPCNSPGSQTVGWDHYENISRSMFRKKLQLESSFSEYSLIYNAASRDLYFIGIKHGIPIFNVDIKDIEKRAVEQTKLQRNLTRTKDFKKLIKSSVVNIPLVTAFVLPDRWFQNIQRSWKWVLVSVRGTLTGR
jgi:SAM-dependent methyltransferase